MRQEVLQKRMVMTWKNCWKNGNRKMKEKMTIVNRGASEQSGKQDICRFIDYAPMVFRKLREVWGISAEEYMLSVGPQQILRTGAVGK